MWSHNCLIPGVSFAADLGCPPSSLIQSALHKVTLRWELHKNAEGSLSIDVGVVIDFSLVPLSGVLHSRAVFNSSLFNARVPTSLINHVSAEMSTREEKISTRNVRTAKVGPLATAPR
jgi:hypothetical protein